MPFDGFTQEMYAQKMIDELKAADVRPRDVFAQSFNIDDVLYWVQHEPAYGRQAVFLDDANVVADLPTFSDLMDYRKKGESESGRRPRLPCSRSTDPTRSSPRRPRATRKTPGSTSSRGRSSDPAFWPTATTASTTKRLIRPSSAKAIFTKCSTSWQKTWASSGCFPTGPHLSPSTPTAWV